MAKALEYKRIIIFGGNIDEINPDVLNLINKDDFILCADKGYEFAVKNKITPNLIVGDFDSAVFPEFINCEKIKLPTQKDDTDLHFGVKTGLDKGFKDFILTGVTGGRLDQTIATIYTLNCIVKNGANAKILDLNTVAYITNNMISIKKPDYPCYFSVFPLGEKTTQVNISGGIYSLENAIISNDFPVGVSNEFKKDIVTVSVEEGTLLILVVKK